MEDMKVFENASNAELFTALALFQGEFKNPKKDSDNPFFKSKYADLADIWEAVRPTLSKHGLAFIQMPSTNEASIQVAGTLAHKSGQAITSTLTLHAKDMSPQSMGSAITYARRYQLCAMLGIAPEEDDDDGNKCSGRDTKPAHGSTARHEKPKVSARQAFEEIRESAKIAKAETQFSKAVDEYLIKEMKGEKALDELTEAEMEGLVKYINAKRGR